MNSGLKPFHKGYRYRGEQKMNIEQFYESINAEYESISSRMMGNRHLVIKFVKKFPNDPTYQKFLEALDPIDYDKLLIAAHTLKGISSNLEFPALQEKSSKLVDLIRGDQLENVLPTADAIKAEYQKIISKIQELE